MNGSFKTSRKRTVLLATVVSETNEHMIDHFDMGNCLALLYLSEYANSDELIKNKYDIYALSPIRTFTRKEVDLFIDRIRRIKPFIIGFSCYIWNYSLTMVLCKAIKEACPETKILL